MKKAKNIMIQGTMSNAGKSILCAGLCRIFKEDDLKVAPFKSQNMALNSFITKDGFEMGRAQVVQAEAAGVEPDVRMNPILLKPTTDVGSQVIVNGKPIGNMRAAEYFAYKKNLVPDIMEAYNSLAEDFDVIVLEGAGSPAEINLKSDDIVNMGMARMVDAPVLLAGDIDRGGVFAQLYGTIALLDEEDRARVKGTIVNKFRGDKNILAPGLDILEEICGVPVVGVVPYLNVDIDDEDSLSTRLDRKTRKLIDIAVIKLPRISNFTDFSPFENYENVSLRYVMKASELADPDMIIIPGTKSTIADLIWLRESGLEAKILQAASRKENPAIVFGICGGFQMLGRHISDPLKTEAAGLTEIDGMGLLPIETVFENEKVQTQTHGVLFDVAGPLAGLSGMEYEGYEIHMGRESFIKNDMDLSEDAKARICSKRSIIYSGSAQETGADKNINTNINIYGTYTHGIFDAPGISDEILKALCVRRGIDFSELGTFDAAAHKEEQYNILAKALRESLDMELIYRIMNR
ncbi:MAG: cobyric acid synthase [Firmicutes bacterium]|nr:cobyric acid synthase [Bacillota bacterium]